VFDALGLSVFSSQNPAKNGVEALTFETRTNTVRLSNDENE